MPRRPCLDLHPDPLRHLHECHLCRLFVHDPAYNRLWEGTGVPDRKVPRLVTDCKFNAGATGREVVCGFG